MGTRSIIGKRDGDTVKVIYCHWDGYPSGVGATLLEHYQDPEKIDRLLSLGDISGLGSDTEAGSTVAYHRDRGEAQEDTSAEVLSWPINAGEVCARKDGAYMYLWDEGWKIAKRWTGDNTEWAPVEDAIAVDL